MTRMLGRGRHHRSFRSPDRAGKRTGDDQAGHVSESQGNARGAELRPRPAPATQVRPGRRGVSAVPRLWPQPPGRRTDLAVRARQVRGCFRVDTKRLGRLSRSSSTGRPNIPELRTAWYRLGELSYMLGRPDRGPSGNRDFCRRQWPASQPRDRLDLPLATSGSGRTISRGARAAYERSLADFPHGQLADRSRYGRDDRWRGWEIPIPRSTSFPRLARNGSSDWVERAWFQIGRIELAAGRHGAAVKAFETLDRVAPRTALKSEAALAGRGPRPSGSAAGSGKAACPSGCRGGRAASRAALALATLRLEHGESKPALALLDDALTRFPQSRRVSCSSVPLGRGPREAEADRPGCASSSSRSPRCAA